jgi:hypothetical protein
MPAFYTIITCPHCGHFGESHMAGVSSGLGRPVYQCIKCGGAYPSGRREWPTMTKAAKCWFAAISLAYAAGVGLFGSIGVGSAVFFLTHGPWHRRIPAEAAFNFTAMGAVAVAVIAIQVMRVIGSNRRVAGSRNSQPLCPNDSSGSAEPYKPPFLLRSGLQLVCISAAFGTGAAGWLIALLIDVAKRTTNLAS